MTPEQIERLRNRTHRVEDVIALLAEWEERDKRLRSFLDGYHDASEEINKVLGRGEDFERIDRELWECGCYSWALHIVEKIKVLKVLAEERGREIERLKAELSRTLAEVERPFREEIENLHRVHASEIETWLEWERKCLAAEARLAKVILILEDYVQDGGNPVLLEHALAAAQPKEEYPVVESRPIPHATNCRCRSCTQPKG